MDKRDYVIAWLSIQITVMSFQLYKDSTKASYLQGKFDMQMSYVSTDDLDGRKK